MDLNDVFLRPKRARKTKTRWEKVNTYDPVALHFGSAQAAFDYAASRRHDRQYWCVFRCGGNWFATNKTLNRALEDRIKDRHSPLGQRLWREISESWKMVTSALGGFNDDAMEVMVHAPEYAGKLIEGYIKQMKRPEYRSKELIAMLEDMMQIKTPTARRYLHMYTNTEACAIKTIKQGTWVVGKPEAIEDFPIRVLDL